MTYPPEAPPQSGPAGPTSAVTSPVPTSAQPAAPALPSPAQAAPRSRSGVVAVRVVGGLVAFGVLLAGSGSLVANFFQQKRTDTVTVGDAVTSLVIRNDVGDVRVGVADAGTPVKVTRTRSWSFREPRVDVTTASGVLTVTGDCSGFAPFSGFCSTDVDVSVPAGTTVRVSTGVGDVRTRGTTGPVDVESGTGDLEVSADGSADVAAETGVGDVTVTGGATGGRVQAHTGTGDVTFRLTAVASDVSAETGTGDVTIGVPAGESYRVQADSGVGDERIGVPRDDASPHRILVTTGTGDITIRAS